MWLWLRNGWFVLFNSILEQSRWNYNQACWLRIFNICFDFFDCACLKETITNIQNSKYLFWFFQLCLPEGIHKNIRNSKFNTSKLMSYQGYKLQVNLCQKHLFLHQLTHILEIVYWITSSVQELTNFYWFRNHRHLYSLMIISLKLLRYNYALGNFSIIH